MQLPSPLTALIALQLAVLTLASPTASPSAPSAPAVAADELKPRQVIFTTSTSTWAIFTTYTTPEIVYTPAITTYFSPAPTVVVVGLSATTTVAQVSLATNFMIAGHRGDCAYWRTQGYVCSGAVGMVGHPRAAAAAAAMAVGVGVWLAAA